MTLHDDRPQIIWDRDMGSLGQDKRSLVDISWPQMGIRGDPNSCYAHYLPFPSADGK